MVSYQDRQTQTGASSQGGTSVFTTFRMSDQEFNHIREMVYSTVGIDIKPHKKPLVINRLSKRLRHLGLKDFSGYLKYLEQGDHSRQEFTELIDCITTNKTDFFREAKHFDCLRDIVVPYFQKMGPSLHLKVWSAACSSGEEPYSLAMSLQEMQTAGKRFSFEILGSDISETILRTAVTGIYAEEKIRPIPFDILRKYFLRGEGRYKVKPELAKHISFKKLNLQHEFHHQMKGFHVIFLRNVMIYFDRPTQQSIVDKCWHVLQPGGFLFLGLSETLHGTSVPFQYAAPSVYQKVTHA